MEAIPFRAPSVGWGDIVRNLTGLRRLLLVGSLFAIVVAACGGANVSADPKGALTDAMRRMGDWEGVTATLSIDSDTASLLALFEEGGLDARMADLVLGSSLGVSWHHGDDPEAREDDEASFSFRLGGVEAASFRQLDEMLYVRMDLDFLIETFADESADAVAEFDASIAEFEALGLGFLTDMRAGKWLQLTGMKQLQSMMEGMAGVPATPDPSELEQINAKMREALTRFVEEDVEVTFVERDDHGDHLRASATGDAMLDLGAELFATMGGLFPETPGLDTDQLVDELRQEAGAEAAEFTVPLDLWISNRVISRIAFDVMALVEANPDAFEGEVVEIPIPEEDLRLGVALELSEFKGGVEAPADAVEVDLFEIFGRLMSGAFLELDEGLDDL